LNDVRKVMMCLVPNEFLSWISLSKFFMNVCKGCNFCINNLS
jgi:hypothetical protein